MIVEFAGLPGSGKSTLHGRATAALSARTENMPAGTAVAEGSLRRARAKGSALAAYWPSFSAGARAVLQSDRSWQHRLFAVRALATTLQTYHRQRAVSGQHLHLLDEGVVQRAFMLFVNPGSDIDMARVEAYASTVPVPDMVVLLRLSPEVATNRRIERMKQPPRLDKKPNRLRGTKEASLMSMFIAGSAMLEYVVDRLRTRSGGRMVVVTIGADDFDTVDAQWQLCILPALLDYRDAVRSS